MASEIQKNIAALKHMDEAIAAMRKALGDVIVSNTAMANKVAEIWGSGNQVSKPIVLGLMAAEGKLDEVSIMLMGAQVEAVHAMVLLDRVAGNT